MPKPADPPDFDSKKLAGVPEEWHEGRVFKIWMDPNGLGQWHVYKTKPPVFVPKTPKPDGNVIDMGGGNGDVLVTGGPSAEQIAQAQRDEELAAERRRIDQQREDDRVAEERRRIADDQRLEDQRREDARLQEARDAESGSGQSDNPDAPEQMPEQDAPPPPEGVGLPVDGPPPLGGTGVTTAQQGTAKTESATADSGGSGGGGSPTNSSYQSQSAASDNVHTVVKDDTMWDIARANGMKLSELVAMNPQIKDPHWIYPGDKINLKPTGSSVLGSSTGNAGISQVSPDPSRVPMGGTTATPDPFSGSKSS